MAKANPKAAPAAAAAETCLDADPNCRGCGSADHTTYEQIAGPHDHDGVRIFWRRTTCTRCSQQRVNRFGGPVPANQGQRD